MAASLLGSQTVRTSLAPMVVMVGLLVAAPTSAWASSARCQGSMRISSCAVPDLDYLWPASSPPTFSALCEYCSGPSPIDAGVDPCTTQPPSPDFLRVKVGDQTFGGLAGQPRYFEATGEKCGDEGLYRYVGPLFPGMEHLIDLGGYGYPGTAVLSFRVAGAAPVVEPPPADAAAAPDVAVTTDVAPDEASPTPKPSPSGCAYGQAPAPVSSAILVLAALALLRLGRSAFKSR